MRTMRAIAHMVLTSVCEDKKEAKEFGREIGITQHVFSHITYSPLFINKIGLQIWNKYFTKRATAMPNHVTRKLIFNKELLQLDKQGKSSASKPLLSLLPDSSKVNEKENDKEKEKSSASKPLLSSLPDSSKEKENDKPENPLPEGGLFPDLVVPGMDEFLAEHGIQNDTTVTTVNANVQGMV